MSKGARRTDDTAVEADISVGEPPNWEHASAATRLLQRRRQMFEVQDALERQKEEYREREAAFKKREAELEAQDLKLQRNLVNFSVFLQEKDSQRVNADKKANEEIRIREQKDIEFKELKGILRRKRQQQADVAKELQNNIKYHLFLDQVVEQEKTGREQVYNDIADIVGRWQTLNELRVEVEGHAKFFLAGNDEYKQKLLTLEEAKQGEILEYQNEIQTLKDTLEDMKLQTLKLQEEDGRQQKKSQSRTLSLGQIKMACDNIFDRVQARSMLKSMDKPEDPVAMLRASGSTIADLISICEEFRGRQANGGAASTSE